MAIVRIVILLCITTGMAMTVLWHARQTVTVGYRITELEDKKVILEERNRMLDGQISSLKAPAQILKNLDEMDIELLPPGEGNDNVSEIRKITKIRKIPTAMKATKATKAAMTMNVVYKSKTKKGTKKDVRLLNRREGR